MGLKNSDLQLKKQADFFDGLGRDYVETVQKEYGAIYGRTVEAIRPFIKGNVLDIGSGGVDLFFSDGLYVFYDIAPKLLDLHSGDNDRFQVCGEASRLPFMTDGFDTVLFHFSMHHFARNSMTETRAYLKVAMEEAKRICKPGGTVIVAENTVSSPVEYLEALIYPLTTRFLNLFDQPPAFFHSETKLRELFDAVKTERICAFKEPSRLLLSPIKIRLQLNPVTIKVFVIDNE